MVGVKFEQLPPAIRKSWIQGEIENLRFDPQTERISFRVSRPFTAAEEDRWHAIRRWPFLLRLWHHYREFRKVGYGARAALHWALPLAR